MIDGLGMISLEEGVGLRLGGPDRTNLVVGDGLGFVGGPGRVTVGGGTL